MASPLYIAQQFFSWQALQKSTPNSTNDPSSYQCINGTPVLVTTNSNSNEAATAFPQNFPSLVDFFFSTTALMEWVKIFIYGSLLGMLRRLVYLIFGRIYNSFFITATFEENDVSYSWVCFWLSRQPAWRSAREIEVSTGAFGFMSSMIEGELEDTVHNGSRQLAFLPAELTVHSMWYKNHWMRVTRHATDGRLGAKIRHIELCLLARSHSVLNDILIEAKKEYEEAKASLIVVFSPDQSNIWQVIAGRPKRSLNSIILDPGIKDILVEDAKNFLASRAWYFARGIPFRRGYLLYGPPGSGKTSIIHSLAGEFGLDMYPISLSKSGMDDTTLNQLISQLPEKCILLMEDIDAAFSQTINRESPTSHNNGDQDNNNNNNNNTDDDDDDETGKSSHQPTTKAGSYNRTSSRITLSGLLNALDGVAAQEGRILFATTNKYGALDPALCRPGRMDIHLEFKNASRYQARELFKCFYTPDDSMMMVVAEDEDEDDNDNDGDGEGEGKGGDRDSSDSDREKEQELESGNTTTKGSTDRPSSKRVILSVAQVEKLAEEFGNAIPEREFSMASLQGYLMGHKVTPVSAVKKAAVWVMEQRQKRRKDKKPSSHNNGVPVLA